MLDHFFITVICPMFYVETLSDLEKAVRQGRTPEQEVGIIARKTPEMHGAACPHHVQLCLGDLFGEHIPLNGRVPVAGGKPVKVEERSGVVIEETPEIEAFRRWQTGEFLEVERRFATAWRQGIHSIDSAAVDAGMRAFGIEPERCGSLQEAKELAERFVTGNVWLADRVKLAVLSLGARPEYEALISARLRGSDARSLAEYAPFASHVVSTQMFFEIALRAIPSLAQESNRADATYLAYLPLCMIFVSSDKFHRRMSEHYLRPNQSFVWGLDLKADLQRLVARYQALPREEQEKGLMRFAGTPPDDGDYLVTQLWKHHFGLLQREAEADFEEVVEGESRELKPLPREEKELVRELNRFAEAPELEPQDIDFDLANPDLLSIQRRVHKRKGSFWQLPKDLKE